MIHGERQAVRGLALATDSATGTGHYHSGVTMFARLAYGTYLAALAALAVLMIQDGVA